MKALTFLLLSIVFLSACGNSDIRQGKHLPAGEEMSGQGTLDHDAFISACMKDAAAWAPDEPRRSRFCACAWQRSQGTYDSATFADGPALGANPRYSYCYEQAGK